MSVRHDDPLGREAAPRSDGTHAIPVTRRLDQTAELAGWGVRPGEDVSPYWFRMKFLEDLSGFRPETCTYYKHFVHAFVNRRFPRQAVEGKRILDLGCGPGFYSAILAQRGALVTGIDLSQFLIDKANEHKARLGLDGLRFLRADFVSHAWQMEPESFDYVLAIDTLVSFDFNRTTHDHARATRAFAGVRRVLRRGGRCLIMESHPFFGQVFREVPGDTGELFCVRSPHYRIEYRRRTDVHHWFTLDEMTRATSEAGLTIVRIREPDPDPAWGDQDPSAYAFRLKYPALIVYEVCRAGDPPEADLVPVS